MKLVPKSRSHTAATPVRIPEFAPVMRAVVPKVLDFDVECRPLAWYGGDFVTKQPTAIAWKWIGDDGPPTVAVIGESDRSSKVLEEEVAMLEAFREAYDQADVVTGHYIRGFDLPTIQGALMRLGLPLLEDKDTHCTKEDLVRVSGVSKSMENLGATFELAHPKIPMNTAKWAMGNMLLPHGIEMTKERVIGDVEEHIELRHVMMTRNYLGPIKEWKRNNHQTSRYHA